MLNFRISSVLRGAIRTARTRVLLPISRQYATLSPFFQQEASQPSIKTEIPGPIALQMRNDLNDVFDTRSLNMLVDYERSYGN